MPKHVFDDSCRLGLAQPVITTRRREVYKSSQCLASLGSQISGTSNASHVLEQEGKHRRHLTPRQLVAYTFTAAQCEYHIAKGLVQSLFAPTDRQTGQAV